MKEFEKRYKKSWSSCPPDASQKDFVWHRGCSWGWKAALMWVLSENGGDCDYHIIEQELEDE